MPRARHRRPRRQGLVVDADDAGPTRHRGANKRVTSPVSLVVTAFATAADDVARHLDPQGSRHGTLILVDLGGGVTASAAILAQTHGAFGAGSDLDDPARSSPSSTRVTALRDRAFGRLPRPVRRRPAAGVRLAFAGSTRASIDLASLAARRPAATTRAVRRRTRGTLGIRQTTGARALAILAGHGLGAM